MKRAKMAVVLALTLVLCSTSLNASAVSGMPRISDGTSPGVAIQEDQFSAVASLDTKGKDSLSSTDASDIIGADDKAFVEGNDDVPESITESEHGDIEPVGAVTSKITVTGGIEGVDYTKAEDGTLTVRTSTPLVLDGGGVAITTEQIVLGTEGENASDINVTIKDIKITKTSSIPPIKIIDNYSKNVNLTIEGTNELIAGDYHSAIEKNSNLESGVLTISGNGSLSAKSGSHSAGIGGRYGSYGNGSNITICGGTVTATGGLYGAGIGGAASGGGQNITICGGMVTANGGEFAAGIGGGSSGAGIIIILSGGTITANGGKDRFGIGSGFPYTGKEVFVRGASVNSSINGALDKRNGNPVYRMAVPSYGESEISYKLSFDTEWTTLSFPYFHEKAVICTLGR